MTRQFTPVDEEEKLAHELANKLLLDAVLDNSSDIHITPERGESVIRYRIDGCLREISRHSHRTVSSLTRVVKKMAAMDPDMTDLPQEGTLPLSADGVRQVDLRVGTLPSYYGETMTLRILDPVDSESLLRGGPQALGFSGDNLRRVDAMMSAPYGLVLFTGPTGCGKTSSILSCLGQMVSRHDGLISIMTLEDPIERPIDGVVQTAVDSQGEFSYVRGIKAVLKHDLDVLYCGEIQNAETAQLLIQVALAGHLVVSQLHAVDVAGALARLTELVTEPYLIGMALEGIVAQRLVRKLCTHCRVRIETSPSTVERFRRDYDVDRLRVTWSRGGCERCKQSGYRGRTVISETVARDDRVSELMARRLPCGDLAQELRQLGYPSIKQDALDLVASGATSLEEAIRTAFM